MTKAREKNLRKETRLRVSIEDLIASRATTEKLRIKVCLGGLTGACCGHQACGAPSCW